MPNENPDQNQSQEINKLYEKMLKNPLLKDKVMLKDMLPVKMSAIILDFAEPLLNNIDMTNKSLLKKTIQKAIEIWNYAIVINKANINDNPTNIRMYKLAIAEIARQKLSFKIGRKRYRELLDRREARYPDYNLYVVEHNIRWSDGDTQMYLSVVTVDVGDTKNPIEL